MGGFRATSAWASLIKEDTCEQIVTTMSSVVGAANQLVAQLAHEWVFGSRCYPSDEKLSREGVFVRV